MLEASRPRAASRPLVEYRRLDAREPLAPDVLAAIAFGAATELPRDPRCIRAPLEPRIGAGLAQVWHGTGPVRLGQSGLVRYAQDGRHIMGWLEVEEAAYGNIAAAAEAAYAALLEFTAASACPHVWRIWNFIADINAGQGDDERYKQFCLGRAAAYAAYAAYAAAGDRRPGIGFPAATAVGTLDGRRRLQLCWLAGTEDGHPLENPRQVSAFRYPRQYGPAAPSFSRAMLTPDGTLLISGTASIVGHGSLHPDDATAQLEETLRNLDALLEAASARGFERSRGAPLLTVFLRRPLDAQWVADRLRAHYAAEAGIVVLDAAICRAELLLEIEAIR